MAGTWYVVADGARAEVLRPLRTGFETVFRMQTDHSRTSELVSDKQGRTSDRAGVHRHAMEPDTDPHRHLKEVFIRDVAARLEQGLRDADCADLVLIADPRSLGELRAMLGPRAKRAILREVGKDLTNLGIKDLHGALQQIGHPGM